MSDDVHTYPVAGEHVTTGLGCWCVPRYYVPCDECGDADGLDAMAEQDGDPRFHSTAADMRVAAGVAGCWKCTDGLIELTVAEADACEQPMVIVHNR